MLSEPQVRRPLSYESIFEDSRMNDQCATRIRLESDAAGAIWLVGARLRRQITWKEASLLARAICRAQRRSASDLQTDAALARWEESRRAA